MDISPCNWGHTVVYRLPARLDPGSWIVRILSLTPDAVFLYIYPHHHWGPHNCIFRAPKKERRSSLQLLYNKLREALWHVDPPLHPRPSQSPWPEKWRTLASWSHHVCLGWGEMRHLKRCLTRITWRRCFPKGKTEKEEERDVNIPKHTKVPSKYHPPHKTSTVKT